MGKSNIEWTDMVWNPVTGCTKVSPGCANCYAERLAMRFTGHFNVTCHPDRLDQPLHWKKPRRIFVCSMGDLFHEDVPEKFIVRVLLRATMTPEHIFMVLTKRPKRMMSLAQKIESNMILPWDIPESIEAAWPPDNLWLGITAENQEQADKRIPILLQIPAAKRFVSIEPMLGEIELFDFLWEWNSNFQPPRFLDEGESYTVPPRIKLDLSLDWIIVGAESGPKRRECKIEDVRCVVHQCKTAGIPVFVKQLHINGKLSKKMAEWPEDLRVREYPG